MTNRTGKGMKTGEKSLKYERNIVPMSTKSDTTFCNYAQLCSIKSIK